MSKGIGKLQRQILEGLPTNGEPFQQNKLLWLLAKENNKITIKSTINAELCEGQILNAFEKSFQRSIASLAKSGHIQRFKRKLSSIDELIRYYPYKTLKLEVFNLRKKLLPVIKEKALKEARIKFHVISIERFLIEKTKEEDNCKYEQAVQGWRSFENKIIELLNIEKKLFCPLLIKGRELFIDNKATYKKSLRALLKEFAQRANNADEEKLCEDMWNFYTDFFKKEDLQHTWLKSQIYSIAHLGHGSRPHLKEETEGVLLREEPKYISSLPGHKENKTWGNNTIGYKYSPLLDKLIDRHAFASFFFIAAN